MATYKLPEGQKLATFKVDENNWEAFKAICDGQGIPASRALTGFISSTIEAGKVDESLLPKPKSSQNIDIDIDSLEARLMDRLMDRLMARLDDRLSGELQPQPPTIDPDIEARLDAMEAALSGK